MKGESGRRDEAWRHVFHAIDPTLTTLISKWSLTWNEIESAQHLHGDLL